MWNYRIGTKVVTANGERAFFIFECYYNKNKIPDGYPEKIDRFKIAINKIMSILNKSHVGNLEISNMGELIYFLEESH